MTLRGFSWCGACLLGLAVLGLSTAWAGRPASTVPRVEAPRSTDQAALAVKLEVRPGSERGAGFVLWQGFDLGWGYNHRINRLGSMVEPRPRADADGEPLCAFGPGGDPVRCRADLTLAAASGTGHDTALIRSYHALVRATGVSVGGATLELHLAGHEARNAIDPEPVCARRTAEVAMPGVDARDSLLGLLGGFDLLSLGDADQFRRFSVQVGEPTVAGPGRVQVPVEACLAVDCGTLECDRADDFDYSLLVPVLVLAAPEGRAHWSRQSVGLDYRWDDVRPLLRSRLGQPTPEGEPLRGPAVDAVQGVTSTVGLSGFSLAVRGSRPRNDLHLLDFGLAVHTRELHGMEPPRVDLFFRNWKPRMHKVVDRTADQASAGHAMWSHREGGRASWTAEAVSVTFADATVLHQQVDEAITWEGFGRTANPEIDPLQASERRIPLYLQLERRDR